MASLIDGILVFLALANLALLGSSRVAGLIRTVAVQGIVLAALPLVTGPAGLTVHHVMIAAGMLVLKGGVFPWWLTRTQREAAVRHEVEPYVGYGRSILAGILLLGAAIWVGKRLPLPPNVGTPFVVPVAFFTVMTGLFLIVARRKAITQVLGFLTVENGIYAFGVAIAHEWPALVELGILLDVFAAVFVMGIAMFHISREFDHLDADRLATLQDWTPARRGGTTVLRRRPVPLPPTTNGK